MIALESFKDDSAIKLVTESNYLKRKKLQKIWHRTDAAIRFFVLCVLSNMLIGNFAINFVILSSVWWILFDIALNLLRGREVLYVGYTSDIDVATRWVADKTKLPAEKLMITVKVLILITAIAI